MADGEKPPRQIDTAWKVTGLVLWAAVALACAVMALHDGDVSTAAHDVIAAWDLIQRADQADDVHTDAPNTVAADTDDTEGAP